MEVENVVVVEEVEEEQEEEEEEEEKEEQDEEEESVSRQTWTHVRKGVSDLLLSAHTTRKKEKKKKKNPILSVAHPHRHKASRFPHCLLRTKEIYVDILDPRHEIGLLPSPPLHSHALPPLPSPLPSFSPPLSAQLSW